MQNSSLDHILLSIDKLPLATQRAIATKVVEGTPISPSDTIVLYEEFDLGLLGMLANLVNERLNEKVVLFNRNFHIEPTNLCVFSCKFCSYRRSEGEEGAWFLTIDDVARVVSEHEGDEATEVHITGGVHPQWDIDYYCELVKRVKSVNPTIHVKAFSAVELDYAISKSGITVEEGLKKLKDCGLDSIPGGGAEIADGKIRDEICGAKTSWERWLEIHRVAHEIGLTTNATMLYGHMETYAHRVEHMNDLRELQQVTGGFNCFIPLKFKSQNNPMGFLGEVSTTEDMRNFAVARIFLHNIPHLKAYWPMLGKGNAKLALSFGADDFDGTIDNSTKIYSMAGAEEQSPSMTVDEVCAMIRSVGKIPVERDSLYNHIRTY